MSPFRRTVLSLLNAPWSNHEVAAFEIPGTCRVLRFDWKAGDTVWRELDAFTPDGPRGPRRELKPGVVAAAQRGGATIIPVHAEASRAWRLHSWDRFMIPKPAARVIIRYGRPFEVGPGESGLADGMVEAERRLEEIAGVLP